MIFMPYATCSHLCFFKFLHSVHFQLKQSRRRSVIIVEDYDTKEIKDIVNCENERGVDNLESGVESIAN